MAEITNMATNRVKTPENVVIEAGHGLEQPRTAIAAAMAFGTVVFLAMATGPIMLSGLVEAGRLTSDALGRVATLEMLGIALGSVLGPVILPHGRSKLKVAVIALGLVALDLASRSANSELAIATLRTLSGLLEGGMLAAATLIITYTANPEAMNGYFLGITTLPQIAATYGLSSYAIPKFGVAIGFEVMALTAVAAAIFTPGMIELRIPKSESAPLKGRRAWRFAEILALFTIVLQNAGVGAGYSYLVQVTAQHQTPNSIVGVGMAALQAAAALGAFAVGWAGWRLNHVYALVIGCGLDALVTLLLGYAISPVIYLVGCCLFGMLWNGLLPFSLKLLIELDPSRRLGLLNAPASLAGLGVGPLLASAFVGGRDVRPAFAVSAALFAASAALYALNARSPTNRFFRSATAADHPRL